MIPLAVDVDLAALLVLSVGQRPKAMFKRLSSVTVLTPAGADLNAMCKLGLA